MIFESAAICLQLADAAPLDFIGLCTVVVPDGLGLATTNKYFHAVQAAACDHVGIGPQPPSDPAAGIYERHGELLRLWIAAQQELTAELLNGLEESPLHRGDTITGELPVDPAAPAFPSLMPAASFATDYAAAASFAERSVRCRGGTGVVYSSIVPVERILATPVTGAANWLEYEIVLLTGSPDDLSTTVWM